MFSYSGHFNSVLNGLKNEGRYREFLNLRRVCGDFPRAQTNINGKRRTITVWCSNDYLGLGQHPTVLTAMIEALEKYGAGAGGTRNISGTHELVVELEHEIARLENKQAALVFSSGYVANQTSLAALGRGLPNCLMISDRLNHDSIIQGLQLGKAQKVVFPHNDVEALEKILEQDSTDRPRMIICESVYSMEGTFGSLKEICRVARKHNALLFVDETHGVGLYGPNGSGFVRELELEDQVDIIQGGLGKGFGVVGGFIAADAELIDFVRSTGNGFIFTTTLPPCIAAGALASLKLLRNNAHDRETIQLRAALLRGSLRHAGIPVFPSTSHIVPILVGDAHKCREITRLLLNRYGMYIQPINFPTVPRGTERLRVTPSPFHTPDMITELVEALTVLWRELELPFTDNYGLVEDGEMAGAVAREFAAAALTAPKESTLPKEL